MLQNALTVITRIKPDELKALKAFLAIIGNDIMGKRNNKHVLFDKLPTTHFARWVIINEVVDPHLIFSSNHDGTWQDYIDLLIAEVGPALDQIWGHCEGYPDGRTQDPALFSQNFKKYIRKHSYEADTFYLAYRGVKVTEMKWYIKLRDGFERILNVDVVRSVIKDFLPAKPLVIVPDPLDRYLRIAFFILGIVISALATIPQFIYLTCFQPLRLRIRRRGIKPINYKISQPEDATSYKAEIEDHIAQNQMTVITHIKPGRLIILRLVLAFVHSAARHLFNQGALADLATIHFARWIVVDDGKLLLFESNYDSTWESYIGDFIDRVSNGMNAIWRHSEGFPPTTGLIATQNGCNDVEAFKRYIRQNQIEAQVFYSAYPENTVRNLLQAYEVCKDLDPKLLVNLHNRVRRGVNWLT